MLKMGLSSQKKLITRIRPAQVISTKRKTVFADATKSHVSLWRYFTMPQKVCQPVRVPFHVLLARVETYFSRFLTVFRY